MNRSLTIILQLCMCDGISGTGKDRSRSVYDILTNVGCGFFNSQPQYPWERLPLDDDGSILPNAGVFHPLLVPSVWSLPGSTDGDGNFMFNQAIGYFYLDQTIAAITLDAPHRAALGQMSFLKLLLPHFRPQFSFVDEFGVNVGAPETHIAKRTLKRLFWFNAFGPGYCEKWGRDVFLNAPVWNTQDLGPLGVAVTVAENLTDWLDRPNLEAVEYFQEIFPGIKPYRARRS